MYNVPSAKRKKRRFVPLNLIPILDVVFILIFFLLTSAQLLRIFEIGSDLPIYRISSEDQKKEDEFELKVSINRNSIVLQNYKQGKIIKEIPVSDWEDENLYRNLNEEVKKIKNNFPDETRVVVVSHREVNYQSLVNVLDNLRNNNGPGIPKEERDLFKQILFEE